jgi:hypothetical protein
MSSEAALKAWATRRAKMEAQAKADAKLAKKRTNAAKKAWATRRANGA